MLAVTCLIFFLFNGGLGARLSTRDEASSHQVHNRNTTYLNGSIAGVRAFTQNEKVEPRILGGKEAWPHSWPWQVVLRYFSVPACGGAILNQYWILTAAHCFRRYAKESSWSVIAGKHDLEDETESCQQNAKVSKIIIHEGYTSITKMNDIALLRLQTPLLFDECVRPIPVWSGDLPSLKRCTITGWGFTTESGPRADRLQEANVTILESESCVRFYAGVFHSTMLCAGEVTGGVDACQGDSGSPLSCFTGMRYEVAGVVSWGVGCGRPQKPGVYTRTTSYSQWINSNIEGQNKDDDSWRISTGSNLFPPHDDAEKTCGQAKLKPCRLDQGTVGFELSEPSSAPRLVNVTEACPHSWPWQVSLQSEDHYCSGTLIDKQWVLTTRHCRAEVGDMVVLGAHDLKSMDSQQILIKAVYSQPYDGSYPPLHDLSLVHLSGPARLGSSVFPVCIPDEDLTFEQGLTCVTTGWGYKRSTLNLNPDVLHQAQVNPLPQEACWSGWGQVFSSDVLLCTQPAASSSCLGDPGAPLLCQKNGQYYLYGMIGLGLKRCDQQKPAIFTGLSSFQPWIKSIMNDEGLS